VHPLVSHESNQVPPWHRERFAHVGDPRLGQVAAQRLLCDDDALVCNREADNEWIGGIPPAAEAGRAAAWWVVSDVDSIAAGTVMV
jgi:hypothetical protein